MHNQGDSAMIHVCLVRCACGLKSVGDCNSTIGSSDKLPGPSTIEKPEVENMPDLQAQISWHAEVKQQ